MAARSSNDEREKDQKDDARGIVTSDEKMTFLRRRTRCYFCQCSFFLKRVLRLVIRECSFYVTIQLIRLDILDGVVTLRREKTVNFLRLSDDRHGFYPTYDDYDTIRSPGTSSEEIASSSIGRSPKKEQRQYYKLWKKLMVDENRDMAAKSGIIELFISRLAENLGLEDCLLEETIDHVMTSHNEVLLDMDFRKLSRTSSKTESEIECTIINMFWQPKTPSKESNSSSASRDHLKDDCWFRFVDRGHVVPFYSKTDVPCFQSSNTARDLLGKCIHEIEESMINAFSWYLDEYFYHDFIYPRISLSYAQYLRYHRMRKICNPKVIVTEDNPLEFGTHFAHVIALNFNSHHKYVRRYMQDIGFMCKSVTRINKDIPFVIRSLNPITRMHMFHMVYKRGNYSRPSYEHLFKVLVMLRDAMIRLRLKDIAMCKIGCCYERLNFGKVLRMTEYVFLDTDINVRIGLNLTKCWHLRSRSLKNLEKSSEMVDLRLERFDRFFSAGDPMPEIRSEFLAKNEE